ncbi:MAG: hypothetical protein AAGE01_12065 [Pseudomonadota bacterium]
MEWLLALAVALWGAEEAPQRADPPPAALLEFLGQFDDEEGEWLDPLTLEAPIDLPVADDEKDDPDAEDTEPDAAADGGDGEPRGRG